MPVTTLDLGPVRSIHRGDWSSTATYETSNIVSYLGSSWMMSASSYTVGTAPAVGGAVWKLMAAQGTSVITDATVENAGIARKATDNEVAAGEEDGAVFVTPFNLHSHGVPSGFIGMWSGATTAIPTGWALCDGTNGTPNLIDRFVVGAGDTYAVGDTGGSADISATVGSTTLTMAQMPSHQHAHGWSTKFIGGGVLYPSQFGDTTLPEQQLGFVVTNGDDAMGYATTLPNTSLAGSSEGHTHSFSADTQANLPPYYALAYIMKL